MKKRYCALLAITVLLQACGSNGGGSTDESNQAKPVHHIQPDQVADYLESFQAQHRQVKLTLDGKEYPVEFLDTLDEEKLALAKFDDGLLLFGFDSDREEPTDSIFQILLGSEALLDRPDRNLVGIEIALTQAGDSYNYSGTVKDLATEGLYPVSFTLNETLFSAGDATFRLDNNVAFVNGTLGASSYIKLKSLIDNHPELDTLVLQQISGSVDDAINMHTGRLVRDAQLTTEVRAGADVNSGGVDLYASGYRRVYQAGAKLGVHSWCCTDGGKDAGQLGRTDPAHGAQLTFFREMLGSELGPEFYFFTIDAAPARDIHVMTKAEVTKFLLADQQH